MVAPAFWNESTHRAVSPEVMRFLGATPLARLPVVAALPKDTTPELRSVESLLGPVAAKAPRAAPVVAVTSIAATIFKALRFMCPPGSRVAK